MYLIPNHRSKNNSWWFCELDPSPAAAASADGLVVARPLRGHGEGMAILLPVAAHDDLLKGIVLESTVDKAILGKPLGETRHFPHYTHHT